MMIEYPPQTSLSLMALGWQCLLVGKLIEFCSRIKHKIRQDDLHIIKQCGSLEVLQVCVHLRVGSSKLPFIQFENVVITDSQTF